MTTKPVVKMTDFFFVAYVGVFDLWLKYMLWQKVEEPYIHISAPPALV